MPHCEPVAYAVAALWECVARAAATWSAIVGRGGGGGGAARVRAKSSVSGYAVADGEGICEYEGARDRSEVVTVE